MTSVSVGASGAIWGLLGAEGALAFSLNSVFPETIRDQARRGVLINLAMNVAISFVPHVDWAAHFAGGVTGFVLAWTGVVLPRRPQNEAVASNVHDSGALKAAATLSLIAYVAAGIWGVLAGRAWELKPPLEFNTQKLPGMSEHVSVPQFLGKPLLVQDNGEQSYRFGDEFGPLALHITPLPEREFGDVEEELPKVEPGLKLLRQPETKLVSGSSLTTASYEYPTGTTLHVAIFVNGSTRWRVVSQVWPGFDADYASVASTAALSLRR
jgi:hypothetical protein